MKRICVSVLASTLALAGCGGGGSKSNKVTGTSASEPNFRVYATSGAGNIDGFSADGTTGKLSPLTGSPYPLAFLAQRFQVSPDNKFVVSNGIGFSAIVTASLFGTAVYSIDPASGALASVPNGLENNGAVVDPQGRFVFDSLVTDAGAGAPLNVSGIFVHQVTAGPSFPPVPGSPFSTSQNPFATNPAGTTLYACAPFPADVEAFQISSDGSLTLLNPNVAACTTEPTLEPPLIFRPDGKFVYNSPGDGVWLYSVDAAGLFHSLGNILATGSMVGIDPSGKFAYVPLCSIAAGCASGTVYSIDPNSGMLSNPVATPGFNAIAFSPQGHFAFTVNNTSTVSIYSVDPNNGGLSLIGATSPSGPIGFVFTAK